jgi:hypothetical protein
MWCLWDMKNKKVFKNKIRDSIKVVIKIKLELFFWITNIMKCINLSYVSPGISQKFRDGTSWNCWFEFLTLSKCINLSQISPGISQKFHILLDRNRIRWKCGTTRSIQIVSLAFTSTSSKICMSWITFILKFDISKFVTTESILN